MISEYFKLASKNLRRRKLRSWLTMIGIFISIATIFILISLSLGLQDAVQEQFRQLGTDKFFIQAKGQLGQPGSGGAVALTTDDVDVISKVSGVNKATYYIIANSKIEFHGQTRFAIVGAIEPEGIEMFSESANLKADEGRILRKGDSNVIMIGSQYKYNNIFKRPLEVGDSLVLNGQSFKIAGILKTVGNPADDKNIFMSEDDFRKLYNVSKRVDVIVVQADEGRQLSEVAEQVKKRLMRSRDVKEKTIDFTIQTPEELLKTFGVILNILTGFLLGVAGISLLVGAIGVANTMYTSVIERTREIGVMKAVGAKNSDILTIFTIEAGLLGLIGGIIGVFLGVIISLSVAYIATTVIGTNLLQAALPWYLIVGCLLFAFLVGAISGMVPARNASKIKPVDALRYE